MYFIGIWYVELQNELANIALEFYFFKVILVFYNYSF